MESRPTSPLVGTQPPHPPGARSGDLKDATSRASALPRTSTFVDEHAITPPPNAANDDRPRLLPRLKVLVVDDNLDAAELLARVLARRNCEVCEAYDGRGAIAKARDFQPDIVLLDIGLPELDGYEVAKVLRQDLPGTCLVALTGYGQVRDVQRARDAGFAYHILKPADIPTLQHILDHVAHSSARPG